MMHFQEMIAKLTWFWADQGCVIHQGYDLEVGAGTFNPATFLRCLGPEPYSAVYVEPSRRPKDGRYGENPNRVQFYHQMQVILKPSPENLQELYLLSLEAIGLDLAQHDIRFVHDDWENPTIGAWGLGWEVWLDGMEVTQFTYFQAVGGLPVSPVSGEITYGLERLAMYLQGVSSLFELKWNEQITYGDIFKRSEWEWSRYNFVEANVAMWLKHFEDFESEAKRLIEQHLPIPAYDFVMKASHAFNMLDARGVISVTERTGYIGRIRALAKMLAESYIQSRERQRFPLMRNHTAKAAFETINLPEPKCDPKEREDLLLEIGCEELPAPFVPIGAHSLQQLITALLKEHQLEFDQLFVYATPRRLAVQVTGLAGGSAPKIIERKGPPLNAAFDDKGAPTKAGEGFFRSLGLNVRHSSQIEQGEIQEIQIQEIKQVPYLMASVEQKGICTRTLLAEWLPKTILAIDFPKKMRWSDLDIEYGRPIRWILALYGSEVIPFRLGTILSSNQTYGHRQLSPNALKLNHASEYLGLLSQNWVMADSKERRVSIENQLAEIEKSFEGKIASKEQVMAQALYLVEWPFVTTAGFDKRYLEAPKEVLICEMVEHQKLFPILNQDGTLSSRFAIVCNNRPTDLIREGNERALSPRLADGMFLYEEDLKVPMDKFNEKLKQITFQRELGSVWNKVERLIAIVEKLHRTLPLCDLGLAIRAATLCKADLASELVGEFPDLQGIVGKLYAQKHGENSEVALAIDEHWMPRGEKAPLPQSACGTLISLAEKIDNLLVSFALEMKPTSSSDPYGLRRQAIGIVKMIINGPHHLSLKGAFNEAFAVLTESAALSTQLVSKLEERKLKTIEEILAFLISRLRTILLDLGFEKDEIEAVLAQKVDDMADLHGKLQALHHFRKTNSSGLAALCEIHTRCKKILLSQNSRLVPSWMAGHLPKGKEMEERFPAVDPTLFKDTSEEELFQSLRSLRQSLYCSLVDRREAKGRQWKEAFTLITRLQAPLNALFEKVKIIDEDLTVRTNRLALLQEVWDLCEELADFSKLQNS